MFFHHAGSLLSKCRPGAESDATELRMVRRFYTYFGWFPWGDFEGESFSEGKVYELTGGQAGTPGPAVTVGAEAEPGEAAEVLI